MGYRVHAGRPFHVSGGRTLSLDVYDPTGRRGLRPAFVLFHGGGWISGAREHVALHLLPWMERGWVTVNVANRLAREAPAPAAAWDARRALAWVMANAGDFGVDPAQVVLGGLSSGGALALLSGMGAPLPPLPDEAGPGEVAPTGVRAIVSWFGVTDVADLLEGERPKAYARRWIGNRPDAADVARRLSPCRWVGPRTPPVVTVHGDRDPTVPYHQAVEFHLRLDAAGVANRLVTMPGAGHGDFGEAGWGRAYQAVFDFLRDQVGIDVDPGARWIPRGDGPNLGRPLPPRPLTT